MGAFSGINGITFPFILATAVRCLFHGYQGYLTAISLCDNSHPFNISYSLTPFQYICSVIVLNFGSWSEDYDSTLNY